MADFIVPSDEPGKVSVRMGCRCGHQWANEWLEGLSVQEFALLIEGSSACPDCGGPALCGWPKDTAHG